MLGVGHPDKVAAWMLDSSQQVGDVTEDRYENIK
jgi:hypothetical protein